MADEETRVARTAGISGTLHVGDLTITPEGTEITQEQWENVVAPAAAENHVIVRLDEDFVPRALQKQQAEETNAKGPEPEQETKDPAVPVETADTNQGTAVDGQPPAPSGRSPRKGS